MTENTAGISINYGDHNKIGSVGKCMPFFDLKIASDGEVLIKGDNVMKGYYKNKKLQMKLSLMAGFTQEMWVK